VATSPGRTNPGDVKALTEWRNRHQTAFLHEFQATEKRTERWLTQTVGPDDGRILFMVDDLGGRAFAYIGLALIDWTSLGCEVDSVLRGMPAPRDAMAAVHQSLIAWARGTLGLERVSLRARADNPVALAFYRNMGYVEEQRVPLRSLSTDDGKLWIEEPALNDAEVEIIYMSLGHQTERAE